MTKKTTFQTAGVIVVGRSAVLFGIKNHPNPSIEGLAVTTSAVKSVRFRDGKPIMVITQNTIYHREESINGTEDESAEREEAAA